MTTNRFAGKVALISGGARGMGAAHAAAIVSQGGSVVIGDLLAEEGNVLATRLGSAATFVELDVTQESSWAHAVQLATTTYDGIDILINNAGISGSQAPIMITEVAEYQRVIDTNQTSVFLGMRAVIAPMGARGGGSIVNISSVAGYLGVPFSIAYTASKFAVRGMSKAAALELARVGIRVNSVYPGFIQTPMTESNPDSWTQMQAAAEGIAAGRVARADEVTAAVLFLASDESSYCTGTEIVVDGGLSDGVFYSNDAANMVADLARSRT